MNVFSWQDRAKSRHEEFTKICIFVHAHCLRKLWKNVFQCPSRLERVLHGVLFPDLKGFYTEFCLYCAPSKKATLPTDKVLVRVEL